MKLTLNLTIYIKTLFWIPILLFFPIPAKINKKTFIYTCIKSCTVFVCILESHHFIFLPREVNVLKSLKNEVNRKQKYIFLETNLKKYLLQF